MPEAKGKPLSSEEALAETDRFYRDRHGFSYKPAMVVAWLRSHVRLPAKGNVLDLCCGDGIWSLGMSEINDRLRFFGVDISTGAVQRARELLPSHADGFLVGDADAGLPFADGSFELMFARGPGLYNQHDMDRPETIAVIEDWHRKLTSRGQFYSIFASTPELMGTYTPPDHVKLPYNRAPRMTPALRFDGGKFHHSIESFLAPFWKAHGVEVVRYSFIGNTHILITRGGTGAST